MKHILTFAALALLAGCTTMTPQERRAADEATCRDFGFRKKNDAFAACLQRLELDRRAQWRANQAQFDEWESDFWYRRYYRRPVVVHHRPPPA